MDSRITRRTPGRRRAAPPSHGASRRRRGRVHRRTSTKPSLAAAAAEVSALGLVRAGAHAAAATLAAASAVHVRWAVGRRTGSPAVIPTVDGAPLFTPSTRATVAVAGLLGAAALLYEGTAVGLHPSAAFRAGAAGAGFVLVARAIGDGRYVGFTKQVRDTPFAAARLGAAVAAVHGARHCRRGGGDAALKPGGDDR